MTTPARPGAAGSDPGTTATEIGRTLPATPTGAGPGARGPAEATGSPFEGRRLAHFRLERPLGKGGMGEVWLATDVALDRPVAIKLLSRDLSADPSLRERFYREARAQARIQHPNVGHIYYIGEEEKQLFFAMELIDGESLAERLSRGGKLPADEALELCRQAALGLREAHRHGFTHRDVKPSNLMIDRHGAVKLVDFGLVKQQREENVALTLENGGGVMGTPLYMAPEQARSEQVDFRTDIYALGATLHHLVSGAPPFEGKTAMQVVSRHLSDPRPHLPVVRKQNPALDPLLDRMMAKDPTQRFASYDDLVVAIDQAAPAAARPAGFFVRAAALVLDLVIVMVLLGLVSSNLEDPWGDLLFRLGLIAYGIVPVGRFGRSLGKWLLEIQIVPEGRQGRPGWRAAVFRFVAQWGPLLIGIGLIEYLFDVSGTQVRTVGEIAALVLIIALMALPLGIGGVVSAFMPDRRAYWDLVAGTRVRYYSKK
jgi:uncharacterized RDD family membrane protein YckC